MVIIGWSNQPMITGNRVNENCRVSELGAVTKARNHGNLLKYEQHLYCI